MKKATHRKQALMIAIFLLAFTLSLFSFGTTPAAAGDVAGVSTHLFLTVLRDYDHDASFSVTYTDALGTHTKPYHAGMEVTAWSPVTITCTNHHVHDWSIDADVQEATIVGVGGITYPGGTGIHVKGTNTIKAFATNFGLHYINIVVILGEGNDNGGDNGGNNGGDSANNGDTENKNNEQAKDFYTDQIDVNGIDVNGKKIVYIAPSLDIEYWQWVEDGVRQACEEYGVSVEVYVSNNSAADQAENGETAVIQGADAVVLSPVSSDSCSTVLDACEDAGIPVTIAAIGSTADNYYAFISADDYTSGYDAGIYLCDQAKALGGDSIGVLALPMDRSNAKAKMAGLEKACEEKGITIAQTIQTSNLTVSESTDMCSDLLTANPDIKGIYCMYEQAGIAAIDVVDNMARFRLSLLTVLPIPLRQSVKAGLQDRSFRKQSARATGQR